MNLAIIESGIRSRYWYLKGLFLNLYLQLHGCKVGRRLKCKQWPVFRIVPNCNIEIGNDVGIGYRITFDIHESGKLVLSNNVNLTQDILISSRKMVFFGEYVSCAEHVSIRDSDHGLKKGVKPHFQESVAEQIIIKKGADIGRGGAIFRGVTIEEDAIIGVNCILMRNFRCVPNGVYLGNPVKLIWKRT
jgi:acetyltransferase-like isoleucine patch superfamily enzyme